MQTLSLAPGVLPRPEPWRDEARSGRASNTNTNNQERREKAKFENAYLDGVAAAVAAGACEEAFARLASRQPCRRASNVTDSAEEFARLAQRPKSQSRRRSRWPARWSVGKFACRWSWVDMPVRDMHRSRLTFRDGMHSPT